MSVETAVAGEPTIDMSEASFADLRKFVDSGAELPAIVTTETAEPAKQIPAAAAPKVESDPAAEPDDSKKDADADDKTLPPGLKKRFHKLTGQIRDLTAQLATKQPVAAAVKPEAAPLPVVRAGEPKAENFETYEAFTKALTRFELQAARTEQAQDAARETLEKGWATRSAAARVKYEDFDETIDEDFPISQFMQEAILTDEGGAELAYWLGKNPDECARIAALPHRAQVVEVARIEGTFVKPAAAAPPPEKKPAVSAAPPPPVPVKPGSDPVSSGDLNDANLSMAAFKKLAASQLSRRPNF